MVHEFDSVSHDGWLCPHTSATVARPMPPHPPLQITTHTPSSSSDGSIFSSDGTAAAVLEMSVYRHRHSRTQGGHGGIFEFNRRWNGEVSEKYSCIMRYQNRIHNIQIFLTLDRGIETKLQMPYLCINSTGAVRSSLSNYICRLLSMSTCRRILSSEQLALSP